ncbi:MAG TPA: hypothetical protein VEA69_17410 [Tepidisphaeraceae bacterium]|nr:hypothetical protein [Tepidisphaeraceae bacterium]
MKLISCHDGKLVRVEQTMLGSGGGFVTGLSDLDALLPPGGLARGAVHDVLWDDRRGHPRPGAFAAVLARAAARSPAPADDLRPVVWADPLGELYPPALVALGIPLDRLFLLRAADADAAEWALAECLACPGVGATVAPVGRLTRVAARRLQLAAERGGGAGILLRPASAALGPGAEHAATTRWLVTPAPGRRTVQRWKIELIHGHGGRPHEPVYLELTRGHDDDGHIGLACRRVETDRVRAPDAVGHRPAPPAAG